MQSDLPILLYEYYYSNNIIVRWNWIINEKNVGNSPDYLKSVLESDSFDDIGIIAVAPGPNKVPIFLSSHTYPVGGLAFSQDGSILGSCSRSEYQPFNITMGKIHLWGIETGMPTSTLRTPGWKDLHFLQMVNTLRVMAVRGFQIVKESSFGI